MTPGHDGGAATVLLVDDHPLIRHGMAEMLAAEPWCAATVHGGSEREALELADRHRPDLAVVDLGLPDGGGVRLVQRLVGRLPGCRIVVLTMTRDGSTVQECLRAGAHGYLLKDSPPQVLLASLRTVRGGGTVLGPGVSSGTGPPGRPAPPFDVLTPREVQLVTLLAGGVATPGIARRLAVTEKTVRNQLAEVQAKVGAADRVQLVLLAQRSGLAAP